MAEIAENRRRRLPWALLCILAVAFLLRVVGLEWGLPNNQHYFSYHPDEIFLLLPSFGFAQGDWNPHFFNYGTLYIYLVGLPAVLLGVLPEAAGLPAGLGPLYLLGRVITALLGAATVLALHLALRRQSRRLALLSAGFLAVCPLHVVNSHYATVDVPATFFLTLAFLLVLRGAERPGAAAGAAAGLGVGLAAATKYNAGLFLLPALVAPVLAGRARSAAAWWFVVPIGAAAGFLIGNPFVGSPEFRDGVLFELRHAQVGGTPAFVDTGSGWGYHLMRGLPAGLGFPLLIACAVGVVASLAARSISPRISVLWIALYLFLIGFGRERFLRYLVPLTPFLCVLAAWGFMWLVESARGPRGQRIAAALGVAAALLTGLYAVGQIASLVRLDPRDLAWRHAQTLLASRAEASEGFSAELAAVRPGGGEPVLLPPRARIGLPSVPWYYDPPVSPYNAGRLSQAWFEEWNRAVGNRIAITGWDVERMRAALPVVFFVSDLEVADLQRLGRADVVGFLAALDREYTGVVFGAGGLPFSWLGPPRHRQPPDWLYPAPRITMYYGASRD